MGCTGEIKRCMSLPRHYKNADPDVFYESVVV